MAEIDKHIGAYPEGENPPILLAYAFRVFFWSVPFYLTLLAVLWSLVYMGAVPLPMNDLVVWHVYELLFGIAAGAVGAFLLTAIPEFYIGVMPIIGRRLAIIVGVWALGRISFWFIDLIGVFVTMVINVSFLGAVLALIAKPIFADKSRTHLGFYLIISLFFLSQILFFFALLGWVDYAPLDLLKFALMIFMAIELAALRRIFVGVGNMVLELRGSSEVFITRAYRYNLAIFAALLFAFVELIAPNSGILGWIALAVFAFTIAIFNDFFLEDTHLFGSSIMFFLGMVAVLIALGFGSMGVAHLADRADLVETLRHFLSMGVIGASLYAVMVVVGFVHTGRDIAVTKPMVIGFLILLAAIFARVIVPLQDSYPLWIYLVSAIFWSVPFLWYLKWFGKILLSPRADGLKG